MGIREACVTVRLAYMSDKSFREAVLASIESVLKEKLPGEDHKETAKEIGDRLYGNQSDNNGDRHNIWVDPCGEYDEIIEIREMGHVVYGDTVVV